MSIDAQREILEKLVRTIFEYIQDVKNLSTHMIEENISVLESSRIQLCEGIVDLSLMGIDA